MVFQYFERLFLFLFISLKIYVLLDVKNLEYVYFCM